MDDDYDMGENCRSTEEELRRVIDSFSDHEDGAAGRNPETTPADLKAVATPSEDTQRAFSRLNIAPPSDSQVLLDSLSAMRQRYGSQSGEP